MIKKIITFSLLFLGVYLSAENAREKIDFNSDWSFYLDDDSIYSTTSYDHSSWRVLDVPHDWSIEGDYASTNPMGGQCGYLPAGIAYYRKTIIVPSEWKGNRVTIAFDGVFMNSAVYANGELLGERPYGWVSFSYDITDIVSSSDEITFAVRVDNDKQPSARWYTGSGIYADTWIKVMAPIHIEDEGGVFVTTDGNKVSVSTEMSNTTTSTAGLTLKTRVLDADGSEVISSEESVSINAETVSSTSQELTIDAPILWSLDNPYLYTLTSELWDGSEMIDQVETSFGVRDVQWLTDSGVFINGENVKLQGVCNHQDAGPLGAAVPDKILRFRIQQLKDMGVNAIRTSHNPQTPKFYDMCDEIGMLVMDEIFDGWKKKAGNDYGAHSFSEWWETDLTDWVRRDRNHPCVIIYSVGNETSGNAIAQALVALCHELDPTRLVTSGHSGSDYMDVVGYNGASERVDYIADLAGGTKPIVGTENTHTWQVRGYYRTHTWYRDGANTNVFLTDDLTETEVFRHDFMSNDDRTKAKMVFNSSYDNAYVRSTSRVHIEQIRDIAYFAGAFRWTGYDYIGEASYVHGGWPFKAFMGGAIDLSNFEKDLFYLYKSQWNAEPMVHILPHWTHPVVEEGVEIPVWVYSNCDEVELFFNEVSLGKQTPGDYHDDMQCQWLVGWEPGTLKVVGYNGGEVTTEQLMTTAGRPAQNELSIDGEALAAEGKDIVQVRVAAQDSAGNFYPYGENRTYFNVIGPGRIRALGNGSPVDVETHYGVDNRIAFYGLTRAFIESTGDQGDINLLASAIMGEKKQITSHMVSIDTEILNLRGASISPDIKVYYTVDGTTPTTSSSLYSSSFAIDSGVTVRALVTVDGDEMQLLSERFAGDVGFVWNEPSAGEIPVDPNSDQAEDATFEGASILTSGSGWNGTGFLDFGSYSNGYVEWYRENDGGEYTADLTIRYGCARDRDISVFVNDVEVATEMVLPSTGSWGNDWGTVSLSIELGMGANTIRLQNVGSGGAYLDQIAVQEQVPNALIDGTKEPSVVVSPIPVQDVLTINGVNNPKWCIYNLSGGKMLSGVGNSIDVSSLSRASYMIHIENEKGKVLVKQLVK